MNALQVTVEDTVATCSCGWQYAGAPDERFALEVGAQHLLAHAGRVATATVPVTP